MKIYDICKVIYICLVTHMHYNLLLIAHMILTLCALVKIFAVCFNIIFVNSLDPDQARQHFVGPDLDPNCLTLGWNSWKEFKLMQADLSKVEISGFSRKRVNNKFLLILICSELFTLRCSIQCI